MANEPPSSPPPPFMANAILNFHFDYLHTSLTEFYHNIDGWIEGAIWFGDLFSLLFLDNWWCPYQSSQEGKDLVCWKPWKGRGDCFSGWWRCALLCFSDVVLLWRGLGNGVVQGVIGIRGRLVRSWCARCQVLSKSWCARCQAAVRPVSALNIDSCSQSACQHPAPACIIKHLICVGRHIYILLWGLYHIIIEKVRSSTD